MTEMERETLYRESAERVEQAQRHRKWRADLSGDEDLSPELLERREAERQRGHVRRAKSVPRRATD